MTNIHNLLEFRLNPDHYRELGKELVTPATQQRLQASIAKLKAISAEHQGLAGEPPEDLESIYELFMQTFCRDPGSLRSLFATRSRCRALSYVLGYQPRKALAIIEQPQALTAALDLLEQNWRPELSGGLLDVMLQHWPSLGRAQIAKWLQHRLNTFPEAMPAGLAELSPFLFSDAGPLKWATWLIQHDKPLTECYRLLGFKEHTRAYAYFLEVARYWLHRRLSQVPWQASLEPVSEWLKQTPGDQSHAKQLLVPLILACDRDRQSLGSESQKTLHQLSDELIGSPEKLGRWQPWSRAADAESEDLEKARKVIESWINQLFIEVFFSELTEEADPERMAFWSRYIRHIDNFKIYGQEDSMYRLMRNSKLREHVPKHWGTLQGDSKQHVFVMICRNYLLIEFGQKGGAFYGIRQDNLDAPKLINRTLNVREFRPANLRANIWPFSASDFESLPEGRMRHDSEWPRRLAFWLEKYVLNG